MNESRDAAQSEIAVRGGTCLKGDRATLVSDALTVERPLQVSINERAFVMTMRTPGADVELVQGLLFSEQVASDPGRFEIEIEQSDGDYEVAQVTIPEVYLCDGVFERRALAVMASCGLCGQREVSTDEAGQVRPAPEVTDARTLAAMYESMKELQHGFASSGGCHAAAAFDGDGHLLAAFEDIGRHNAVDKVVGALLMSRRLEDAVYLLVSGRISFEIVVKTGRAGIPVLAAVSAASTLAVDTARHWGISLHAFCRGEQATRYD
jgi:FdhD protein